MTHDSERGPADDGGALPHDESHERLVAAVLTGDLARDDDAARTLQRCDVCRERLLRLERVTGLLDEAGVERREILDDAVERPRATAAARRGRPVLWAAAAALLAVALLYAPVSTCAAGQPPAGPNPNLLLGADDPQAGQVAPQGEVDAFAEFRWPAAELLLDERFVVEVFEERDDGGLAAAPLAVSEPLEAGSWIPEGEQAAAIDRCRRIQWKVLVRDLVTREQRTVFWVLAWRP